MSPIRTNGNAAVEATLTRFGRLDALVNNAGIVKVGQLRGSSVADWQQVIDVNLTGAYLGMRAVVESLIIGGGGSIINISSVEGLGGQRSYARLRGGQVRPPRHHQVHGRRVRIARHPRQLHPPGLVLTPMSKGVTDDFMAPIPDRRGAVPSEISTFVVLLVSDESTYATGAEFVIDGGLTSYVPVKI